MRTIVKGMLFTGSIAGLYVFMDYIAKHRKDASDINRDTLYLEEKTEKDVQTQEVPTLDVKLYGKIVKPLLDKVLSFVGLIFLSPVFACISIAVYLDDPGAIFFIQKRVGKDKKLFELHKFRTMKMDTPHDVPTHHLQNPEQYITKIGKVLRKYSLDELPQIWDIFRGKMSVVGPRPALWNQNDLVDERDKYGVNSIMPGLTGLAQIRGRDELGIEDKARLDGEYTKKMKHGGLEAFFLDTRVLFETVVSVLKHDGVVEGGTGTESRNPDI